MRWGMSQQKRHGVVYRGVSHRVVVVQEQIDFVLDVGQIVDQQRHGSTRLDQRRLQHQTNSRLARACADVPQRMGYIEEEPCGLVVVAVESKPGN